MSLVPRGEGRASFVPWGRTGMSLSWVSGDSVSAVSIISPINMSGVSIDLL